MKQMCDTIYRNLLNKKIIMPETLDQLLAQNEITGSQLNPNVLSNITQELLRLPETEREAALRQLASKALQDAEDEIATLKNNIEAQ